MKTSHKRLYYEVYNHRHVDISGRETILCCFVDCTITCCDEMAAQFALNRGSNVFTKCRFIGEGWPDYILQTQAT